MGNYDDFVLLAMLPGIELSREASSILYLNSISIAALGLIVSIPFFIIGSLTVFGGVKRILCREFLWIYRQDSCSKYVIGDDLVDELKNNGCKAVKAIEEGILSETMRSDDVSLPRPIMICAAASICSGNIGRGPVVYGLEETGYEFKEGGFVECEYVKKTLKVRNDELKDGKTESDNRKEEKKKVLILDYFSRFIIWSIAHMCINRNAKIPLFLAEYEMGCYEHEVYNARRSQYEQWYCFFELIPTQKKRLKYALHRFYEGILLGYQYNNFGVLCLKRKIDETLILSLLKNKAVRLLSRIEKIFMGYH